MLKNDGILFLKLGILEKVLERNLFDTIYHEHLDYHHAVPLVKHLTKLGFDVIELKPVKSQGGSIRILLKKLVEEKYIKKLTVFYYLKKNLVYLIIHFLKIGQI